MYYTSIVFLSISLTPNGAMTDQTYCPAYSPPKVCSEPGKILHKVTIVKMPCSYYVIYGR